MPKSLKPRAGARPKGTPSKRAELSREVEASGNGTGRPSGGPFQRCSGSDLLSHPVTRAVPSALEGFTSGFGMGPGVSPPPWPPKPGVLTDVGEGAALERSREPR